MAPHTRSSSIAMNSNVKKKDSRIVKIALKESGDAGPFRRVDLVMLNGSHQRLCKAAAELAAADTPNAKVVAYKLKLTYKDEEGDHCLLINDKDVQLAVLGRTTPLKVFADIVEFSAVSQNPPRVTNPHVHMSPPCQGFARPATKSTTATATAVSPSTTTDPQQQPPVLHQAVESIVGAVADAVVGLQAALPEKRKSKEIAPDESANVQPSDPPTAATTTTTPEAYSEETKPMALETTQETAKSVSVHPRHTCDGCRMRPIVGTRYHASNMIDFDLCEKCYAVKDNLHLKNELGHAVHFEAFERDQPAPTATSAAAKESSTTTTTTTTPEPVDQNRPFIHGRHTCDSCLVTPIIGKRYHAKNMLDYDLCEFCHENYTGDEVEFEEEELDRDRPMQERWNRRFNRYRLGHRHHHHRRGQGRGFRGGRWNGPPAGPFPCGTPPFPPPPPPHAGPFPPPPHAGPFPPPHAGPAPPHAPVPPAFFRQQNPAPGNFGATAPHEPEDAALKEAIRRSLEECRPLEALKGQDDLEEEYQLYWRRVQEALKGQDVKKEAETQTEQATNSEGVQTEAPEPEIVVPPPTGVSTPPGAPKSPNSTNSPGLDDSTFALEAAGNGDVATVLGETMDRIASAIQEMNLEIERECNQSSVEVNESDAETDNETPPVVVETVDEDEEKTGDVIISGETNEEDISSQNSWDVVEHQPANDESLARAAQELGSALFNSGMTPNAQVNDSNISVATLDSVPTTLPSLDSETQIPIALLERWAGHLQQMHDLGFYNDVLAVETLERLQAANIGSDETEEITVQRLVNELVKD